MPWNEHGRSVPDGDGSLSRWYIETPLVLQRAIKDCWDGRGTPAQKLLLSEWVTARVMHKPIPVAALRAAWQAERMEELREESRREARRGVDSVRGRDGAVRRRSA